MSLGNGFSRIGTSQLGEYSEAITYCSRLIEKPPALLEVSQDAGTHTDFEAHRSASQTIPYIAAQARPSHPTMRQR